jgi:hypothetical protein
MISGRLNKIDIINQELRVTGRFCSRLIEGFS